jgi:hypothetical protein
MGVGDNVTVGVKVGDPKPGTGRGGWAVCVNNTTTVCATAVSSRPGTGVATETLEVVHASAAIIKMTTAQRIGLGFNIFSCFRSTLVIIIPKSMVSPLPSKRLSSDFVPDFIKLML